MTKLGRRVRSAGALMPTAAALALLAQAVAPCTALAQTETDHSRMSMPETRRPAARPAAVPAASPAGGHGPHATPASPATVAPGLGHPAPAAKPAEPGAGWPSPVADNAPNSFLLVDLLEFQRGLHIEAARWDIVGWYGGDSERVWVKSEGRYNGALRTGEMDLQVLYGRLVFPFIDLQAGLRYEQQLSWDNGLGRGFAVLGVQGLVPFGMELEAAIFLSQHGDLSTRLTLTQDFLLTQRLILQPRVELNAALQSVERYGVGSGVNDLEIGLRLRYEILREFAPYVGVSWLNSFGETAALRAAGGEPRSVLQVVAGLRMWF